MDVAAALTRSTVVHDRAAVSAAYDRLAAAISRTLGTREPLVLSVLLGGLLPTAELLRRFGFPCELDCLHATRYRDAQQGAAALEWRVRPRAALAGRVVLLVDDILDEGLTLREVAAACRAAGAAELHVAVLAEKQHARRVPGIHADFVGLTVPDRWVFGCGMDLGGRWRGLPELRALAPEDER
jgi:hypoxanthine phosphoribosyltransferase